MTRCAACALLAAGAALGMAHATLAQTPVRVTLDSKFEGPDAPFLVGLDKNYYRDEGLYVSIDPAGGALEAIRRVASGAFDIGFADFNTLIKYRDQNPGAPVTAVFMVQNRPPFSILTRKSRGVGKPKDLEGKKLGAPAADPAFAQWKIFTRTTGIDPAKVDIENVGLPVREPMLAAGEVDAITGSSFSSYVNLKDRGVPVDDIVVLRMSDYGVDLYGNAIFVNQKFAADHPDAVRGFLRAFVKGLKDTIKEPDAAVGSVLKRNEATKKDIELERLRMALKDNIATPEVSARGYGEIDPVRFEAAIGQIALTHDFKAKPRPGAVFDSSFLPPAAERAVD
ncbi:MAG: ABC transporter substrate-binding protein [Xanthobacteraceae bacterium]|nr:ABC transporter substrate-binding protein [Xanthobacteraceae bacterium]